MGRDKVTTLSADPVIAKTEFTAVLAKKDTTIMFILGNSDTIITSMDYANDEANDVLGFSRWVVWIKDLDELKKEVKALLKKVSKEDKNASRSFEEIKCFCLSPETRVVAGIILKNGTLLKNGNLDYTGLASSFADAELIDA